MTHGIPCIFTNQSMEQNAMKIIQQPGVGIQCTVTYITYTALIQECYSIYVVLILQLSTVEVSIVFILILE